MNDNKIAIAYRIYPGVSKVPPVYPKDKMKLARLCLNSMINALCNIDYKIFAILDGCPKSYYDMFEEIVPAGRLEIVETKKIGNQQTFLKQFELLTAQTFSDIIYFAEDDYFYLDNAFSEMLEVILSKKADFVTPYDHLDYYEHSLHNYEQKIIEETKRKWKAVSTTCMTFMASRESLLKNKTIFLSYSKNNYDNSMWLALTKLKVWNPRLYINSLFKRTFPFKILLKMWYYGWSGLIFGKKHILAAPVPTLATHMDSAHLAPGIDWSQQFSRQT